MAKENESPAWTDSSDDNKLIVHRVNAADVDEPEVSSPAPAPIQGGEDEVIRVSHIRSIEVKTNMNEVQSPRENGGRFSRRRAQNEDHDDLESVVSDCAPMDVIEKSPYEPFSNAEKGVKLFSDMKSLLAESKDDDYRSVSTKATRIFGPSNAWCLVKANGMSSDGYCLCQNLVGSH